MDLMSLFEFFGSICHQEPGRSPSLAGKAIFLCARCVGIFIAYLVTLAAVAAGGRQRLPVRIGPFVAIPLLFSVLAMVVSANGLLFPDTSRYRMGVGAFFGASLALTNSILFAAAYRGVAPPAHINGRGTIVQAHRFRLALGLVGMCLLGAGLLLDPFAMVCFCLVGGVCICFFVNSALVVAAVVPTSTPGGQRARLIVAIPVAVATFQMIGRLPL